MKNILPEFRVMVAGSRGFNNYQLLYEVVDKALTDRHIFPTTHNVIIVSGKAKGADTLGEQYAKEKEYLIEEYPAKWNDLTATPCKIKHGKYGPYNALAGMNRNIDMVKISDLVVMFHDGISSGTAHDLKLCQQFNKDYEYINYKK